MDKTENLLGINALLHALITQIYRRIVTALYVRIPPLRRLRPLVVDRGKYLLRFSPTRFAIALYRYPSLPRDDEAFLSNFLKPGMTYVDVGANIGTTTLAGAAAVGPTGTVIAFEPHPGTFRDLSDSVALNPDLAPRISLIRSAVGDTVGTAHISDLPENDVNHIHPGGIQVQMTTLDDELEFTQHIDLLKIDVEGYEKNVLQGAKRTLAKTDAVYFESCEANFAGFGYSSDDLFDLLHESGFCCYTVDPADFTLAEVEKGRRCVQGYENLLACRVGQRRLRDASRESVRSGA